uniref:U-box domain-containing protein n=1 Tax=Kalanchoe fedtschenkoi TaxID=63787 RepID=A0A7N0TRJ7_KALFE
MLEKVRKRAMSSFGEDLCVTVPSLFRCPISLDLMKSPVSLSTGVTYDRSSIQKWLDGGHNTCPATMQVLNSRDFVPNHTLHRLIQIWSESANEVLSASVPSKDQARELIAEMRRGSDSASATATEKLEQVARFGAESDENRRYLIRLDGFAALLVDLICNNADRDLAEQALKIAAATFSGEDSEARKLKDCVPSLLTFLQTSSSSDAKIAAAQVLEIIASDAESKTQISEHESLQTQLVKLVDQATDSTLLEAVLACLASLSLAKRVRVKLVRLGLVAKLANLLTSEKISVATTERVLKLMETVSSCEEGRREICEHPNCIPWILTKTMKVSTAATEHAVTILWSVCYLFRDQEAQEAVERNNGLTKILLVLQSNCAAGVRQMAGDLLKIFRVNSKSCLWSYDTKTSHIMPF